MSGRRPGPRRGRRAAGLAACLAALLGAAAPPAGAQEPADGAPAAYGAYVVKAAFLYNFARFTEWPREAYIDAAAPLRVCVLGRDPFGAALDPIAGKRIKDRLVSVARIARLEKAAACQVLFISASESARLGEIVSRLAGRPVLTITDLSGAAGPAGMINLRTVADKVRFEIDRERAARSGLRFSAKLLRLAG